MRRATHLTALLLALLVLQLASPAAASPADKASLKTAGKAADKTTNATLVYLVRHAEKEAADVSLDPRDPHLTEAGESRAEELARVLGEAGIDTIFATPFFRTRETAAPLAEQTGVAVTNTPIDPGYATRLAQRIRADYAGKTILVVGHSNTTPDLIRALGVTSADSLALNDDEYDDLFLVTLPPQGGAWLARVRFGAETP